MTKYLLSIFVFLQFIIINIHAQDTSKENDFYKQKYYEEKFIILNRDIIAKELEIKELKEELKLLKQEFNQNIDEKTLDLKGLMDRQDERIRDIDSDIDFYSILITVLFALGSLGTYFTVSSKAMRETRDEFTNFKKELEEKVKEEFVIAIAKNEEEFQQKVNDVMKQFDNKGEKLLSEIKIKSEKLHSHTEKLNKQHEEKLKYLESLENKTFSEEEKAKEKAKAEAIISNKKEEDYTEEDLYELFLSKYINDDFAQALEMLDKLLTNPNVSDTMQSLALYSRGLTFAKLGEHEKAIEVYDEVITKFKDSKDNVILERVAKALFSKGFRLGVIGENEKAIEVYDEVITRFKDSKDNVILEQVERAFLNKAVSFNNIGKHDVAIKIYDEIINTYLDSKNNIVLDLIPIALFNKGYTLNISGNQERAMEVYDEIIEKFQNSEEISIQKQVIKALNQKAFLLREKGEDEKSIEVYDNVIEKFQDSNDKVLLEELVIAFSNIIELNLMRDNIRKKDFELYYKIVKNNKEQLMEYKILKILEDGKTKEQDKEIEIWKNEFKNETLINWSFDELKAWSETLEPKAKERIQRYIKIFEEKQQASN